MNFWHFFGTQFTGVAGYINVLLYTAFLLKNKEKWMVWLYYEKLCFGPFKDWEAAVLPLNYARGPTRSLACPRRQAEARRRLPGPAAGGGVKCPRGEKRRHGYR
jgi:hypothetical protein